MRIGIGYDIHRLDVESRKPLQLGGVTIESVAGVVAHSDGDVICHAITDALLGAAGLGDMGQHFPDTDPTYKDADSVEMLRETVLLVEKSGLVTQNVDCVVAIERPKLSDQREEMERTLTEVVGAPVSVKAKRGESVGEIGRGEAIACWATALLTEANGSNA